MDNKVTVVMNGYKRSYAAKEQYEAYRNQSVGTPEMLFWGNTPETHDVETQELPYKKYVVDGSTSAICNENLGVWARFAYALNAKTPFVCVVDDDTIPGSKWLENCIDTTYALNKPCVLTTRGVKLKNSDYPVPGSYSTAGWCNPNEKTERVDFGGHCWFFSKTVLKAFWLQAPDVLPLNYGEDIHISWAAWQTFKGETFVPPHPVDQPELWGSQRDTAIHFGEDLSATSRDRDASIGMNRYVQGILKSGYKPVLYREQEEDDEDNQV